MSAQYRKDYHSKKGFARWWGKDGGWHIALPCPDPDPLTGYKTGGYCYIDGCFSTRKEAVAAILARTQTESQ